MKIKNHAVRASGARSTTALTSAVLLAGASLISTPAMAGHFARVTTADDAGAGSLRHALEQEQASVILISPEVGDIQISSTLEYAGTSKLTLIGRGQTIRTTENTTLLSVLNGADLTVKNLSFQGPGGFDITNRGDIGQDAGKGIFVDVRDDQTGEVKLFLQNVSVSGVANHGIHVSDCSLADDCGGGSGGGGEGSAASIRIVLKDVSVSDVGNGKFDADGLRVDDRGDGGIYMLAIDSSFTNVGADGVELDEGNDGDVQIKALRTVFADNGAYCDPALLEAYLPAEDEGEFEETDEITEEQIPGPINGSPDDGCFEREVDLYDSGFVEAYEFGIDLDDGIDLDEAGDGKLSAVMIASTISGNLDEGVDFDEAGDGDAVLRFVNSQAFGNNDDGFKVSEEDEGSVYAVVRGVTSADNGGKGLVFEEENEGEVWVSVVGTLTYNNDDSDDTGLEVVQDDEGRGKLKVRNSSIEDGIDTDGVEQI